MLELQPTSRARTLVQGRGGAACRARGIFAFCGKGGLLWQSAFLIEQVLPARVHHGHDLGKILWPLAQVDAHGSGVAMGVAGILAIQNGGNVRREACIENFLGLCDSSRHTGDDLRICQLLEGFFFGHAPIVAYLAIELKRQPRVGTPMPDHAVNGAQAASFVGPAGVGAMSDAQYQSFINQAYAAVATLNLTAGTIYYQKLWTALSLLMMTGNLVDFTQIVR